MAKFTGIPLDDQLVKDAVEAVKVVDGKVSLLEMAKEFERRKCTSYRTKCCGGRGWNDRDADQGRHWRCLGKLSGGLDVTVTRQQGVVKFRGEFAHPLRAVGEICAGLSAPRASEIISVIKAPEVARAFVPGKLSVRTALLQARLPSGRPPPKKPGKKSARFARPGGGLSRCSNACSP